MRPLRFGGNRLYKHPAGPNRRHDLWSKESFLSDYANVGSVKGVCEIYADDVTGWRAYYNDVIEWKNSDRKFSAAMRTIQEERGISNQAGPGRKRKDMGDLSWQEDFLVALVEHSGNRKKAAAVTPYSLGAINDMIDPKTVSYDETFAKMVDEVTAEMAADYEETLFKLNDPERYSSLEEAKITQTKAWVVLKFLEKVDPNRYGRKSSVEVQGNIKHQHNLGPAKSRDQLLAELWDEQKLMIEKRIALPAPKIAFNANTTEPEKIPAQTENSVLDAEIVSYEE